MPMASMYYVSVLCGVAMACDVQALCIGIAHDMNKECSLDEARYETAVLINAYDVGSMTTQRGC